MSEAAIIPDTKPRLGFVGLGWIGLNRMQAVLEEGCAVATAVVEPDGNAAGRALEIASGADLLQDFEQVTTSNVEGVVIATPSGLHAEQSILALESGKAVFCQKPLGRTALETQRVIDAARRHDLLLGVDLCYRYTRALQAVRETVQSGEVGDVYAIDLTFHNAYGPSKNWALESSLSGGGCVIDLGIHLVDMLLWTLDWPEVAAVTSRLFHDGRPLDLPTESVENYAVARIDLENGAVATMACSWNMPAGCDAVIEASFLGTRGAASFRNVNGSFYDFVAERRNGASTTVIASPPDDWGRRAVVDWARRLAASPGFDADIEHVVGVARVLDQIYGRRAE